MPKPRLLIFDVNETLLDLEPLKQAINDLMDGDRFAIWFKTLLHYSWAENLSGNYRDFGEIGADCLQMLAREEGIRIRESDIEEALGQVNLLPPHPEVPAALHSLKEQGFRLTALTNGDAQTLARQMDHSGLKPCFDALYSVADVLHFKPHAAPYRHVLDKEGENSAMLVAAHAWDILGAARAGLSTAFISRPGKAAYPGGPQADLTFNDLGEFSAYWK